MAVVKGLEQIQKYSNVSATSSMNPHESPVTQWQFAVVGLAPLEDLNQLFGPDLELAELRHLQLIQEPGRGCQARSCTGLCISEFLCPSYKWANALVPPTPSLKGGLGVAMVHGWPP